MSTLERTMNAIAPTSDKSRINDADAGRMRAILDKQRAAFTSARPEPLSVRRDRIERAIAMLIDHKDAFAKAVSADFGNRSVEFTLMTDIFPSVAAFKHAKKHFAAWSRDDKRKPLFPLGLIGAGARVVYQPKGVVGVIAPWNFPVGLLMEPLAGILAAGNRAIIKPSEFTPRVADLFADLVPKFFAEEEVAVVTGGVEAATAFSRLAFDHLVFTGATAVGKQIMRAAADNLVPVTLELSEKSPTIVGRSADLAKAGQRIAMGKMMNAGQVCLAPDYLLVAKEQEEKIIASIVAGASAMYPTLLTNDDYTSVINARHYERLRSYLTDAREKGAELIEVNPAKEDFVGSNGAKMPLTIVRGVTDAMKVMQEEIFGPILPVMTYETIDQAIDYVNAHDRPLGLYYFGADRAEENHVLSRTISGGVTVNDVVFHHAMEDLPFGGVGPSGMGSYHGIDGFRTFSHARAVYRQTGMDVAGIAGFKPPYGKATRSTLKRELRK
jgi:coniferyl-aldehyde dehydrogenase